MGNQDTTYIRGNSDKLRVMTYFLQLWETKKELRFGQLVYNLMADHLFDLSDQETLERINNWLAGKEPQFKRISEKEIEFRADTEQERQEFLQEMLDEEPKHSLAELEARFGPDSKPYYSTYDRVSLDMQTFWENIVHNPSVVMDRAAYQMAKEAYDAMYRLYQHLSINDNDKTE